MVKNPPANAGNIRDTDWIPRSGRSPRGRHGNPLQYCCLENAMDRGAWKTIVHRVAKSWTWLKRLSMHRLATRIQESNWWPSESRLAGWAGCVVPRQSMLQHLPSERWTLSQVNSDTSQLCVFVLLASVSFPSIKPGCTWLYWDIVTLKLNSKVGI